MEISITENDREALRMWYSKKEAISKWRGYNKKKKQQSSHIKVMSFLFLFLYFFFSFEY